MKSILNINFNHMNFRFTLILFLAFVTSATLAQTKKQPAGTSKNPVQTEAKTETKPEAKPANAQTEKPAASALTEHFYKKYVTAIQWNDYVVAKDALYDLIVENPLNDSLIFDLAYFYYENQQYASSVLVSQQLLVRNPKDVNVLQMSAASYEAMGLADKALQQYESAYLLTNQIAMLYKVAFLQYDLKRYTECLTSIDILLANKDIDTLKVIFNDADNKQKEYAMRVSVLNLKGLATLDHFGDKAAAKKSFDAALAIAPDFQPAKQNLTKVK
jgi:tetratricopeptide (TPR) repeat protein